MTVLTINIQVQVKAQEQKMVEQSANDRNEIKAQLKDVDAGHQTLVQKVLLSFVARRRLKNRP